MSPGLPRAALVAGLAALALALPVALVLPDAGARTARPMLDLGALCAGFLAGIAGALGLGLGRVGEGRGGSAGASPREPPPTRPPSQQLALKPRPGRLATALAEIAAALSVAAVAALAVAFAYLGVGTAIGAAGAATAAAAASGLLAAATALAGHALGRGALLLWAAWERRRRRRLLWALTHGQLLAALTLAVVVAAGLVAADLTGGQVVPPELDALLLGDSGAAARAVGILLFRVLPAGAALLLLSVLVALALVPAAALISYLVLRRATRRIEQLAAAANRLRGGDLSARVAVDGQDELAALQRGFNAMAADLARTLRELEDERDRVAGLLEARRQLVASVSHELRTPIATARGYLESVLAREGLASAERRDDLQTVAGELVRLERLIDDLFALARAEIGRLALRLEPVDVGTLVARQVATAAPLAWQQRRVEVAADVAPDLPPARADAQRLEQVVSNLLANATRHTGPGGLVVVAVSAEPDALRVAVRDTGEGIPPEELPRVFERFHRVAGQPGDGAGLGLALVKELVEAMDGSVAVESTVGEGSCFTLRLPLLRQNRDT